MVLFSSRRIRYRDLCLVLERKALSFSFQTRPSSSHPPNAQKNLSVKAPIALTKIFALTSLLNLLEIKSKNLTGVATLHQVLVLQCIVIVPNEITLLSIVNQGKTGNSFISIKFEDNGVASWDKGKISKMPFDHQCDNSWNDSGKKAKKIKSVVEHAKPRATLRWRRRIGHLFQVIRWKKSNKGNMCHVGTKPRKSKG
ncbi:hypothetical protein DH2020_007851 [Rehmannia glutinosa]|uniref:Uncharacterized protein n=1 Tax=Rehmannia glutinosa TaxID=99300 RepID=A0ABR0TZD3_REHGL